MIFKISLIWLISSKPSSAGLELAEMIASMIRSELIQNRLWVGLQLFQIWNE